jgi:fructose-specific phosphotransferase system component IIB
VLLLEALAVKVCSSGLTHTAVAASYLINSETSDLCHKLKYEAIELI